MLDIHVVREKVSLQRERQNKIARFEAGETDDLQTFGQHAPESRDARQLSSFNGAQSLVRAPDIDPRE